MLVSTDPSSKRPPAPDVANSRASASVGAPMDAQTQRGYLTFREIQNAF
jgi:hypothetical protein